MDIPKKIWSRVQPRGGTQIPQEIRELLKLSPGDVLIWNTYGDGSNVRVWKGDLKEVTVSWPHKTNP